MKWRHKPNKLENGQVRKEGRMGNYRMQVN